MRDTRPEAPLAYYGDFRPATLFYSDRVGPVLELPAEAMGFLRENGREDEASELEAILPASDSHGSSASET